MKLLLLKKPDCMPCGMVERHLNGKLDSINHEIYDVETESGMTIASMYGAMSVPAIIALDENGVVAARITGYKPAEMDALITRLKENTR